MDLASDRDGSAPSGEPIRCELVPVTPRMAETLSWSPKRKAKVELADPDPGLPMAPPLVLDVGIRDAIRVIDAHTKVLIASAWLAQATATPGIYERLSNDGEGVTVDYTQPLLVLEVPGPQKLRIGIPPVRVTGWSGAQFRYAWRWKANARKWPMPTHVLTDTDWLTLVQRLGLGAMVVEEYVSGRLDRRERLSKLFWIPLVGLVIALITIVMVYGLIHHMH